MGSKHLALVGYDNLSSYKARHAGNDNGVKRAYRPIGGFCAGEKDLLVWHNLSAWVGVVHSEEREKENIDIGKERRY